jgi:hypothetical protein
MKRIIFLVAALLTVFSGVAAVTAYEGHAIDVKAHVENAILVDNYEADFGITFPQEPKEMSCWIGLSESFRSQPTWSTVNYSLYWEPKPINHTPVGGVPATGIDPDNDGMFEPIYPYISIKIDGALQSPDANKNITKNEVTAVYAGSGDMSWSSDMQDDIHMIFTPPVVDKWYNVTTDPKPNPGVLHLAENDYVITTEHFTDGVSQTLMDALCPHADLGSILKVQVTGFIVHGGTAPPPGPGH